MVSEKITGIYDSLSKTHKKVADFVLRNYTEASYLTIRQLSEKTGAGEATIIRFCMKLGYDGYPGFRAAIRKDLSEKNDISARLQRSYQVYEGKGEALIKMFEDDVERIKSTLERLDAEAFFSVCGDLILARRIYIIAGRSTAALGHFLSYYLNMALGNVVLITEKGCDSDQLVNLSSTDAVVGISFARYTRSTIELFRYAREKGAKTIAITDTSVSPLVKDADHYLLTETYIDSYIDSFAAPMTLINAILTEIGRNRNVELEKRIHDLNGFYEKYDIFEQ
ncbi:MAG: MurR/RpiR family transcriptional regulator [Christensenellaceae bacterium]|nr:MurR/RpiR family transcriptional regulator [Christensenellaceae bacterium]